MKPLCIIGGKLQGFEVAYLARKAGMEVILADKNPRPLIRNAVDEFICFDITENPDLLYEISGRVCGIIPTNENPGTLRFLKGMASKLACPLFFDFDAYHVSMDKKRSKTYFTSVGVPTPSDNPPEPPFFVKPPCMSGSIGARIIESTEEAARLGPEMLIEEYVPGPVISLEVVGDGRNAAVGGQTEIHIDEVYDCHKVTPMQRNEEFADIARKLALGLKLKGIMDVEAILSPSGIKVIEIDARFPSQTPTVIYHSHGINLLEWLIGAFSGKTPQEKSAELQYCTYEHLLVQGQELVPSGEHVISAGEDYEEFHEEEGIEIFKCTGESTAYTLICTAGNRAQAGEKRKRAIGIIRKDMEGR
jgi:pyrrolysine biosynthesis protein PylC